MLQLLPITRDPRAKNMDEKLILMDVYHPHLPDVSDLKIINIKILSLKIVVFFRLDSTDYKFKFCFPLQKLKWA